MAKVIALSFLLCTFVLVDVVTGHKACTYSSVNLKKRAASEEECREKCRTYTHPTKGSCFAYLYDAKTNDCDGRVFDTDAEYTDHEECGANPGADLTLPDPSDAMPSIESYKGCGFSLVDLGPAFTKEKCEELCWNFDPENESNKYGGCAAWFWDPDGEDCEGLLSSGNTYSNDICGVV